MAHWLGTEWTSLGNGGTTGNTTAGTLVTGDGCLTPIAATDFGIFTLASNTSENVLPVTLLSFTAVPVDRSVALNWVTASEENADRFDLFRSVDGVNWQFLTDVDAIGNSVQLLSYESIDETPFFGVSYYLLQEIDLDGEIRNSEVRSVNFEVNTQDWLLYPNPAQEIITLSGLAASETTFWVYDALGRDCSAEIDLIYQAGSLVKLDISELNSGLYIIRGELGVARFRKL